MYKKIQTHRREVAKKFMREEKEGVYNNYL
jgi:hypothetical protein